MKGCYFSEVAGFSHKDKCCNKQFLFTFLFQQSIISHIVNLVFDVIVTMMTS